MKEKRGVLIEEGQHHAHRMLCDCVIMICLRGEEVYTQFPSKPPLADGYNSVVFDPISFHFSFFHNQKILYKYSLLEGGTLHGLRAVADDGSVFWPSNFGGIRAEFLGGVNRYPWEPGVTITRLDAERVADTVITSWRMTYQQSSLEYRFRLHVAGRTLIIRVEVLNGSQKATSFELDRAVSEECPKARRVVVPQLTLFNVLLCNNMFTSMFFDWELTNCSALEPYTAFNYEGNSVNYSQRAIYSKKTDGSRTVLRETIYLTVSPSLGQVLPTLSGPVGPKKDQLSNRLILSYFSPFPWLVKPPDYYQPYPYRYLDSIKNCGVESLAIIIKNWNLGQFDNRYPCYGQADAWDFFVCDTFAAGGGGGNTNLRRLRDYIVDTLSYDFALHENYADFYTNALCGEFGYDPRREAKLPNGTFVHGHSYFCLRTRQRILSRILKPSLVPHFAAFWSDSIKTLWSPTWSHLDVHSAVNPSGPLTYDERDGPVRGYVDFDTRIDPVNNPGADSAGMFVYTLHRYRELAGIHRATYDGPVQGEGRNHFLYAGYYDGFDGSLYTGDHTIRGVNVPLLVDFDLRRIHSKSVQHGVGHLSEFLKLPPGFTGTQDTSDVMIETYLATELAFGHGGLVTKGNVVDHSIRHATLEYEHIFPMQRAYMNASPTRIEYWDGEGEYFASASEYIRNNPGYADSANAVQFMGRVKVTYENGVEVVVNRSQEPWLVKAGVPGGWFTYNLQGTDAPLSGFVQHNNFFLKAGRGWVGYNPLRRSP